MSKYVQPTLEQFQTVLTPQGFQAIELPGTLELVLAKRVDKDGQPLSLRVYTSLDPNGLGRDCGEDAIRVEVYYRTPEATIRRVGGSKRINRVAGWDKRLSERIEKWEESLGPQCPKCGSPTVERNGKESKFWGCCRFPTCRGSLSKGVNE